MNVTAQQDSVEARILALAGTLLARRGLKPPSDPSARLKDAGLSSLELVNLMLAVEEAFDIFIPEDRMTPTHLESATSMARLVQELGVRC